MPNCPQCTKPLRQFARKCPSCQADLELLLDLVSHLQGGLERAENLTRAGELGQAMWAYLEVLEVDPDNPQARKQISQIVTAVRQFDKTLPGRRWANGLPPLPETAARPWWQWLLIIGGSLLLGFAICYLIFEVEMPELPAIPPAINQDNAMGAGAGKP